MLRLLEMLFSGGSREKKALEELDLDIAEKAEILYNWEIKDLDLMSLIQTDRDFSFFQNSIEGTINTIYSEPMVVYKYAKMKGFGNIELCVAKMAHISFKYIINKGHVSHFINENYLGVLKPDGFLYATKRHRLAHIDFATGEWWDIHIQGKKLGSLCNIQKARDVAPRAFDLKRNLSSDELAIFLCIAIFQIIDKTKDEKRLRFK